MTKKIRLFYIGLRLAIINITLTAQVFATGHVTAIIQPLTFGAVVPITGQCQMAFSTGIFTSDFSNTCPTHNGLPGHYRVLAPKNTFMRITPYTFTYPGNLFTFKPTGEVSSDTETKTMIANNVTIIDSGASGILDIHVGGILNVTVPLNTSSSYLVDLEIDISISP